MKDTFRRFLKTLPLAILFAVLFGTGWWLLEKKTVEKPIPEKPAINPDLPTAKDVSAATVSKRAFADYAAESKTTTDDLKIIDRLIRQFFLIAKDQSSRFPMGNNREITRVLAGHNPMSRAWIPADHPAIDERGELIDRWKNPLHFHALARGVFEIRSAGPDGTLFTEDDIKIGTPSQQS
ncbi:MAG: hypothetical protein ACKVJU_01320 [Verrucomicrobiales bacterium]